MHSNHRTLLRVAGLVSIFIIFITLFLKRENLYSVPIFLERSIHNIKFNSKDLESHWDSVCSKELFVFCDKSRNKLYEENVRKKVSQERTLGLVRKGNNSEVLENASQELINDPYHRVNKRLRSGQPVVIHVINPANWLVNDLKKIRCPVDACVFDMDRVTEETDVVMAHGVRLTDGMMPMRRWPGQLYVMYGRESPLHYNSDIMEENSTWRYSFNLTSTYRIDSDIFWPYGRLDYSPWPANQKPDFDKIARSKAKLAVWMVSNCKAPSLRNEYVEEMKVGLNWTVRSLNVCGGRYIPVDVFGRCGNATDCPRTTHDPCLIDILQQYKFYLSFENSMCPDYVTEKFFKTYYSNLSVIPVVRGGADYDALFPRGTFVNAGWFRTARELALYLRDMPDETYVQYLETNRLFREGRPYSITCYVCHALIIQQTTPRIYDIRSWLIQQCPVPRFL